MTAALLEQYDGLVCDLDGVVYAGPSAIAHAPQALTDVVAAGRQVVFATNNASRPPEAVAQHLRQLDVPCADSDVINSSMAGAHVLGATGVKGNVLAVGGEGVGLALQAAGFVPVSAQEHRDGTSVGAVLQGYGPDVRAQDLAEAAYAIQNGACWVATNTDSTLPTDRGRAPGNGSLVAAVRMAVSVEPAVAGKPQPVMYDMATQRMRLKRKRVLAVGDRLETDIQGACAGHFDSVLVLTGVHGWADAAAAPTSQRPTYVIEDLRGLFETYVVAEVSACRPAVQSSVPQLRAALAWAWEQCDSGAWSADDARAHFERVAGSQQ